MDKSLCRHRNMSRLDKQLCVVRYRYVCPRPEGQRCSVLTLHSMTVSRRRNGAVLHRFPSALPNGSHQTNAGPNGYCILDCIFHDPDQTYYVLDVMCWKVHYRLRGCERVCRTCAIWLMRERTSDQVLVAVHFACRATHSTTAAPNFAYFGSTPSWLRRLQGGPQGQTMGTGLRRCRSTAAIEASDAVAGIGAFCSVLQQKVCCVAFKASKPCLIARRRAAGSIFRRDALREGRAVLDITARGITSPD